VDSRRSRVDNIFIQKSIVMGIGAMTEDDLDLSDSSENRRFMIGGIWPRYAKNVKYRLKAFYIG
jgi:hypothetical protein